MTERSGEIPFPELCEAALDDATLDALVGDILREARVLAVLVKGGATTLAGGGDVTLEAAVGLLREGRARAVQVRYEHRGQVWTDTLLRGAAGLRLVRIGAAA